MAMAMAVTSLLPSSSHFSSCRLLSMPSHRALDKLFGIHYGGRLWKKALSTSATYSQTRDFSARLQDRIDKLPELVQDIFQTSIKTGPRGAIRLVQGIQAVMDVGGEWLLDVSKSANISTDALAGLQFGLLGPTYLRRLFERMGATYIKLGQFIASTPTLFPADYVKEFQNCFDKAPAVPFHEVEGIINEELRQPLENVYEYIDPIPIASASIAQVHGARLRGSKQEVVIKVLKPGIEDFLISDLNFLYVVARMLEFLNPQISRTSLVGIVGDIRETMMEEVDFQKEAANIESFKAYLETMGLTRQATAPKVYRHCSTRRVLTMERLYGVPLTDLDSIRSLVSSPEVTLITALNVWFGSLLSCETFHADVHAGNLWLLRDGRIGFLDFGIVGHISPRTWTAIETFLTSVASGQYETMAIALVQMGATNNDIDTKSFARDLDKIFSSIQDMDSELIIAATRGANNATISTNLAFDERQMNALFLDVITISRKLAMGDGSLHKCTTFQVLSAHVIYSAHAICSAGEPLEKGLSFGAGLIQKAMERVTDRFGSRSPSVRVEITAIEFGWRGPCNSSASQGYCDNSFPWAEHQRSYGASSSLHGALPTVCLRLAFEFAGHRRQRWTIDLSAIHVVIATIFSL